MVVLTPAQFAVLITKHFKLRLVSENKSSPLKLKRSATAKCQNLTDFFLWAYKVQLRKVSLLLSRPFHLFVECEQILTEKKVRVLCSVCKDLEKTSKQLFVVTVVFFAAFWIIFSFWNTCLVYKCWWWFLYWPLSGSVCNLNWSAFSDRKRCTEFSWPIV